MESSPPSQAEIAQSVEDAFRNASYVEVWGRVYQVSDNGRDLDDSVTGGRDPIIFWSAMKKDAFTTFVWHEGAECELGELFRAFSLADGRLQDYLRETDETGGGLGGADTILESASPYSHGTGQPIRTHRKDCLVGDRTFSNVGVPADNSLPTSAIDTAKSMRNKVEGGVRLADSVENGRDCYVFRQDFLDENGNVVISHVVYVIKQTYFVTRWDTLNSGVWRKRLFTLKVRDMVPSDSIRMLSDVFNFPVVRVD
jgi:hypothetical protein